jgi:hypothetical protein
MIEMASYGSMSIGQKLGGISTCVAGGMTRSQYNLNITTPPVHAISRKLRLARPAKLTIHPYLSELLCSHTPDLASKSYNNKEAHPAVALTHQESSKP